MSGAVCDLCYLLMSVPPKLSPFGPPLSLHVGERASMTCSVVSGDQPLSLHWLKDGRPLEPTHPADPMDSMAAVGRGRGQRGQGQEAHQGPRVIQNRVDQYNSILLIESLSPEHNGSYTCSASNQASEVSQSQELLVNGTPILPLGTLARGLRGRLRVYRGLQGWPGVVRAWGLEGRPAWAC